MFSRAQVSLHPSLTSLSSWKAVSAPTLDWSLYSHPKAVEYHLKEQFKNHVVWVTPTGVPNKWEGPSDQIKYIDTSTILPLSLTIPKAHFPPHSLEFGVYLIYFII